MTISELSRAVTAPPLLGLVWHTLDFFVFSGWERYFEKRRASHNSTVFKTHFPTKAVAILDHQGLEPLFNWDGRLEKDHAFGWAKPPPALVGNIVPSVFLPAESHDPYKAFYMEVLKTRAKALIPTFLSVSSDFHRKWREMQRFSWTEEAENFCATLVFQWFLGEAPNPKDVRKLYLNLFLHTFVAVTKYLPWSAHSRSVPIFRRLLSFLRGTKGFAELSALARKMGLEDEDALAKQMLFLFGMNSFLGLQGMTKSLIGELSLRPELREALRAEIRSTIGESLEGNLSFEVLGRMPILDQVVKEVLRLHPPVFFIFGRAARDFTLTAKTGRYAVSAGDQLMGVLPIAHLDDGVYPEPKTFRPGRFEESQTADHLLWPHGPHYGEVTPHSRICPGKDLAVIIGKLFCVTLLADNEWELKTPPRWSSHYYSLNVASPVGGLPVSRFARLQNKSST